MGRGRSDVTKGIVARAHGILEAENPMTLRQLFYRLVSVRALENRQADYQRLSRIMTVARDRGEVPFEWIVDRSRPEYEPDPFKNPAEYAERIKRAYRRDYWQDQPEYVEVWCEKDTVYGSIEPIVREYGVTLRTGRGYQSTTRRYEIAKLFTDKMDADKEICVFYLGDHDPSGRDAERDIAARVRRCILAQFQYPPVFEISRLAIHREDIALFGLPPLRIKTTDSRAQGFKRVHGTACVELDALPPVELRRRLQEAIEERIDRPAWDRAVAVEQVETASIQKIAGKIANL